MIRIWYTDKHAFINLMMGIGERPKINNIKDTHKVVWENLETGEDADELKVRGYENEKCKEMMELFNSPYRNPLANGDYGRKFQQKMKDDEIDVIHTGMSVGDVIQINDNYYLVDMGGFAKLEKR